MTTATHTRAFLGAVAVILSAIIALAPGGAALAQSPPAGMARVWFLRQFTPGGSLATPWIYINGAPLTTSQPGTIFHHDLPPGTYNFAVESCGIDVNQTLTLQLPPGSQADLEVQSLESMTPRDCPRGTSTFYVRPIAPRFLQLYLPHLANLGAR
ncbi:MAG TPA: hypothetical protein VJR70_00675 [Stellaceae bacterium]|nr:hypothetical protein [Stellaceae bacterium]